ncbi:MAG TPA: hypothetical protein VGK73_01735 [Polyangiaceae bacterium]
MISRSVLLFVPLVLGACHGGAQFAQKPGDTPQACEGRREELVRFVKELPERALGADLRADLPVTTLGAAPGTGPVLVVTENSLLFDGESTTRERFQARAAELPPRSSLYVAAAPDVTIRTLRASLASVPAGVDLKLLIRSAGKAPALAADPSIPEEAREIAGRLLAEGNPTEQKALAERGYSEFSNCAPLKSAIASVGPRPPRERWPALKQAFDGALPSCSCDSLDAPALRALLAAEQRAGTATLAVLPLSFVRDERCEASMGLRSVKKLLDQMEKFDADNAGAWSDDALRFEQVITNDRLRERFCDALPGETLAALEKAKRMLYFRVPGPETCEAWRFEPLAPGAPMGTLRRAAPATGSPAALHYWQAAEELDLFGPVEEKSKPTDERDWTCRTRYRMTGIDAESIALESGRWFFTEASCRKAPPEAVAPPTCSTPTTATPLGAASPDTAPAIPPAAPPTTSPAAGGAPPR